MAELETTSSCCSPTAQDACCEPTDKAECCGTDGSSCGCSAGREANPSDIQKPGPAASPDP